MLPKSINKILKNPYVLYALTIYTFRTLYRLMQERKYNRLILFSATGLITACFSKNPGLSLIFSISALWAFNYYKIVREPFEEKFNNMEAMLGEMEDIMAGNAKKGGTKMLDVLSTTKNMSSDELKSKILKLLNMGTNSSAKNDLRVKLSGDLQGRMKQVNASLDKMSKIGNNGQMI